MENNFIQMVNNFIQMVNNFIQMVNNFIQMAASAGHAVTYTIGTIKLHSMFCALFLKIALSAAELMSFGHLVAAI